MTHWEKEINRISEQHQKNIAKINRDEKIRIWIIIILIALWCFSPVLIPALLEAWEKLK